MAVAEKGAASPVVSDAGGGELVHLRGGNARLNEGSNLVKDRTSNDTGLPHRFEIPPVAFENHCGEGGGHESSKLQAPSGGEIPKSKSQIPKKYQAPSSKPCVC